MLRTRFVAVADNSSNLQYQEDAKGRFFREIAEQGHYAGRTHPTDTRQGLYAATASGRLLSSVNSFEPSVVQAMLHRALEAWDPTHDAGDAGAYAPDVRFSRPTPDDVVALRQYVRDLPRQGQDADPRFNIDHAWVTAAEVAALVPAAATPMARFAAPGSLIRRLARFHLVDTVRGEAPRYRAEHVEKATMTVTARGDGGRVTLGLEGRVRAEAPPSHRANPFNGAVLDKPRGIDVRLQGRAEVVRGRVEHLDLVGVGTRWGAAMYNARFEDPGPAPIAFSFELASGQLVIQPQAVMLPGYLDP